ncbi:hypothetical protein HGRIS_009568 [Hohenbuehelia grisea]|uniref:Bromo domain-containing protein n=1 Tax=Hohenbuehelia grisea TaxID=104357 RepID=A0ABR3J1Z3_9AGAR
MSTRSTRRSTANAAAEGNVLASLQPIDCLLLAQAVWELGACSWPAVAKLLTKHPLLSHPKSFFTPQSCLTIYHHIMKDAGLECTEGADALHAASHLKLAQKHYQIRVLELRDLIAAEEAKFKTLVSEIDAIRSGLWDTKIKAKLSGEPEPELEIQESPATDEDEDATFQQPQPEKRSFSPEETSEEMQTAQELIVAEPTEETAEINEDLQATAQPEQEPISATEELAPGQTTSNPIEIESEQTKLSPTLEPPLPEETAELAEIQLDEPPEPQVVDEQPVLDPHSDMKVDDDHDSDATIDDEPPHLDELMDEQPDSANVSTGKPTPEPEWQAEDAEMEVAEPTENQPPIRRSSRRRQSSAVASSALPVETPEVEPSPSRDASESAPMEVDVTELTSPEPETTPGLKIEEEDELPSPSPHEGSSRREGKRKASFIDAVDTRDRKRPRDDSEPLDEDEQGSTPGPSRRGTKRQDGVVVSKKFQSVIGLLHSQISQHRNGTIFHNPIKPSEAPDYHEIVKRPMDLKTIKARIKDGFITTSREFQRDIYLMFANAMMYNRPDTDIYTMAEDMMLESEDQINSFRQTEGYVRGTQGHRI